MRPSRAPRGQERALPQPGRRNVRGRVGQGGHHEGLGDLRPRREHLRLRRRRMDRLVRGQRLEPGSPLPQQPGRNLHRRGGHRRVRLQPGRQAPGRDGGGHRRLRPQRHHGHLQDQLRRRHVHAVREQRRRPLRGPDLRERHRHEHPLARLGRGLRRPGQRRLARRLSRERPRLSRGRRAPDRGGLQAKKGGLPEPPERPPRRRDGPAGPARHRAQGGPGRRFRRLRRRRLGGRGREQRQRHPEPLPHHRPSEEPLAHPAPRRHALQQERHRGPRPCRDPGRTSDAGGPGRGQLRVAERPAGALRPGRGGRRSSASRCAGRTASRRSGATWPRTAWSPSPKPRGRR